jgi:molybdate transport system ATP-binding protein
VQGLRWQAQDISAAPPHRRPFGWLPQELGLWPHLSALGHLAFARSRGRSAQPSEEDAALLAEVGLTHRATALPAQLSGGERQRLAFARVMALQPAWAVLDEPFSHLDPVMSSELAQSFQALAQRLGMGLIQVSHQVQRPAADDWFWAMEDGSLTQSGPWAEFVNAPATAWIARFVSLQS